jgi:hypothetical protein
MQSRVIGVLPAAAQPPPNLALLSFAADLLHPGGGLTVSASLGGEFAPGAASYGGTISIGVTVLAHRPFSRQHVRIGDR